ncbi:C4-dicarboxylate transport transcriptional regulatory protein dctD [Vibrio nigripulchritudo SOn1]|uniref:C4-dicarboxylate transport transcriptional regulatory protein dctD n=1 Tax=Vibrio nigripulchritudo SOn1 TaxID=1238450 RepID=A0AAV2VLU5_9VIBR|nr:sigma-54 dependent transcriptional regulator [Vibrio nigripulchritudo]CCO45454.1 C4-dicarboxylate transport transcriptional regulatory protein dctD [Vibrio nigripulchritudo SOn1]
MDSQIVLIEDDDIVRQATSQWLQLAGFSVTEFADGTSVLEGISPTFTGVIVSDVRLPDSDGLTLMNAILNRVPNVPIVLVTGHGDVDMAVKALREGAYDFLEKPFDPDRLIDTVSDAFSSLQAKKESQQRLDYLEQLDGLEQILIGQSEAMVNLRQQLAKIAAMDTNVIVYGETGCGKELVANCLHKLSRRSVHRFVPINCSAIPENLFESELFGHEAGAFTGAGKQRIGKLEYADKGTLFLDEIESMPLSMQVKVLRTLQEHTVERVGANQPINIDLRVVAAAKDNLFDHPNFRQDLYYRLNVAQLTLPPLRERDKDVVLLFEHYSRQANSSCRPATLSDKQTLLSYGWPGNVRELKNVATRFAHDDLSVADILSESASLSSEPVVNTLSLATQVHNFERKVIDKSLREHKGNITQVMAELDLPRRTLNQKMQKYGLSRQDYLGK